MFPVFLAIAFVLQCCWFIRTQSLTFDEPVHIAEGLNAWRFGRFEQYNDHPPLARLWCTLPLLNPRWQVEIQQLPDTFRVSRIASDPEALAWRARAMNLILGLVLMLLVWRITRRPFSVGAANLALSLFAFSPSLIAHFSIAGTDAAAVLLIFAGACSVIWWGRNPNWKRSLLLGLILGLMLLAKFSTAPMFFVALVWILILTPAGVKLDPRGWSYWSALAITVVAFITVWAGFFFHVSHLTIRQGTLTATFPNWEQPIVKAVRNRNDLSLYIPAGEYIEGFRELVRHNRHGQPAYLLGRISAQGGWKLYYPEVIALKWPTIVLGLSMIGFALAIRDKPRLPEVWILTSFPAIYLAFACFARFNIGERHVLPVYPFAIVLAASLWQFATVSRGAKSLLILLALANAIDGLRCAPGYLSYFNIFVRPSSSYRLLTDSNLDWGQGLLYLREYQREHPNEQIFVAYFGSVDPISYGIHVQLLEENERRTGTIIVSATNLSGQYLKNPAAYRWLLSRSASQILDGSLFVFDVKEVGLRDSSSIVLPAAVK